ncbi:MAG: LacI family transcriptional regulator [Candidatus Hydrogenedentota bacterium]|nr:MAG: LacI family transcriptional regulator [Candidatus Hydrogenedentota bacterium]
MSVTIREIARTLGLSESTVSRALTGKATLKTSTIERVKKTAEELGYVPNLMARGLAARRSGIIGMAVPTLEYPHGEFYSRVLHGVEQTVTRLGYHLLYFPYRNGTASTIPYQSFLDGILLFGPLSNEETSSAVLEKIHIPVVILDDNLPDYPSVFSQNREGASLLARYLLSLGHRQFLFIGGPENHPTVQQREKGFRETLRKECSDPTRIESLYVDWREDHHAGRRAMRKILQSGLDELTAVVGANDMLAIGALLELRENGISVPDRVSVAGFDDSLACEIVSPSLTSVRQAGEDMGEVAVELLHNFITEEITNSREKVSTQTRLITRQSTKRRSLDNPPS